MSQHRCLNQLVIERYLHGEFDGARKAEVEAQVADCERCQAKLSQTQSHEAAFGLRPVPDGIRQLWTTEKRRRARWQWIVVGVPAAAALALTFGLLTSPTTDDGEYIPALDPLARSTQTRAMGPAQGVDQSAVQRSDNTVHLGERPPLELGFFLFKDGKEQKGESGQRLKGGDRIQFWYDAPGPGTGVIVGIDAKQQVTRYFPAGPVSQGAIKGGLGHVIGSSVIMDDTTGIERYYLCYSKGVLDPGAVERAAKAIAQKVARGAPAELPFNCQQATIWIERE